MSFVLVSCKGIDWKVFDNLEISVPPTSVEYIRYRNGKEQKLTHTRTEKILSQCVAKNGYLEVAVKIGGKRTKCSVHRLIAMAFVDGYKDGLHVNHINGVKTDNRPENLEWVTMAENISHAWRTGLVDLSGEKHPAHKLSQKQVICIRKLLLESNITCGQIALLCGVSTSIIDLIKQNKRWVDIF